MDEKKRVDSLDIAKWCCALLIILIHASPFAQGTNVEFFVVNVFARIAVPVFFAISGYLFFRKITFENDRIARTSENLKCLIHYVKNLSKIYIASSVFYLLYKIPFWYSINWWGLRAFKDYIVSFFLKGSEYHLWYILASIYGMLLLYVLLTFIRINVIKVLFAVGWIVECLEYSYSWIGTENIGILNWFISHFTVCFDAMFRAIPLIGIGLLCATRSIKKISIATPIIMFGILAAEASCLHFFVKTDGGYSYILFTPLFAYCMLQWLLSIDFRFKNEIVAKWMRDTSLIIYIVHPMIIYLLDFFSVPKGSMFWMSASILSIAAATVFIILKKRFSGYIVWREDN